MTTRRSFLKAALGPIAVSISPIPAFGESLIPGRTHMTMPRISLAQWSLHRAIENGELDARDFASTAIETYELDAVEYVSIFYEDLGSNEKFWGGMKERADNAGVSSQLIMVDDEGDLGHLNDEKRKRAVENHYKWINAAKLLGCHSVRVNAYGEGTKEHVRDALIDGMGQLSDYAAKEGINVILENHGLHTSDAKFIAGIIKAVNKSNLGTLPDFGNWCLNEKWVGIANNECSEVYDPYLGVAELIPYAKAVSAKSYDFNEKGEETTLDYSKMLQIVKDSGFDGHIGIEYEGPRLSEPDGIRATKALIEKVWKQLD